MGWFARKRRGYSAAFKVETWRPRAEELRREKPEAYQQILVQAEGEAAVAAEKDPDAFVALWLHYANEASDENT